MRFIVFHVGFCHFIPLLPPFFGILLIFWVFILILLFFLWRLWICWSRLLLVFHIASILLCFFWFFCFVFVFWIFLRLFAVKSRIWLFFLLVFLWFCLEFFIFHLFRLLLFDGFVFFLSLLLLCLLFVKIIVLITFWIVGSKPTHWHCQCIHSAWQRSNTQCKCFPDHMSTIINLISQSGYMNHSQLLRFLCHLYDFAQHRLTVVNETTTNNDFGFGEMSTFRGLSKCRPSDLEDNH